MSILLFWLVLVTALCSCSQHAPVTIPYIPPSYYDCIASMPSDLVAAYYSSYANTAYAQQNYNGQVFVFHKILVNEYMLRYKAQDYLETSTIKCEALYHNSIDSLRVGEAIDIVGINEGAPQGTPAGWLLMTGCVFLPAGSVQLPAPGGATLSPLY